MKSFFLALGLLSFLAMPVVAQDANETIIGRLNRLEANQKALAAQVSANQAEVKALLKQIADKLDSQQSSVSAPAATQPGTTFYTYSGSCGTASAGGCGSGGLFQGGLLDRLRERRTNRLGW